MYGRRLYPLLLNGDNMKMKNSGKVAFLGILTALSLVCLLITAQPLATVGLAAMAALFGIPVVVEWGRLTGCLHFAAVCLLAAVLIPSVEGKLMYVCSFGHYTVVKAWLEHLPLPRWVEYVLKILVFLLSVVGYGGAWYTLTDPALPEWFQLWMLAPAVGVLTVLFVVYDRCLSGVATLYMRRLHPLVSRLFRFP